MNSKGLLLAEETLKIVISLIALGFLIYFLSMLYFNNVGAQEKAMAEASLKRIDDVVGNDLSTVETISEITPAGWSLFYFNSSMQEPNSCFGQSCACICESVFLNFGDRQINECDKKGVCLAIPNLIPFSKIDIASPGISILIEKNNGGISLTKQ